MKITEIKGDVKFYEDNKGKLFQQIKDDEIFKVIDGDMKYKTIKQVNNCAIKYNTNGVHGFTIFKGNRALEDNIWTLEEAERISREL